jgi:hypothetical protein
MQNAIDMSFDLTNAGNSELVDIRDVKIDTSLPLEERMKSYIRQIKNPHHYKYGDITVRISFTNTDATLEDRIKQLLTAPCTT